MNVSLKQDYISDPSFDYGQQNATIEGILKKRKEISFLKYSIYNTANHEIERTILDQN